MQELLTDQWTPAIRKLLALAERDPAGIRCMAVLDGRSRGRVWVDDPAAPSWAVLQESGFGSLYLGGQISAPGLAELIERLRQEGQVLVGLWPDDPRLALFPRPVNYEGRCLDFYHRDRGVLLEPYLSLPASFRLEPATADNLRGRPCAELMIAVNGSLEKALEHEHGYLIYQGDAVVCEAIFGAPIRGMVEAGVETDPAYRRQGLATFACAYLVREYERQGYEVWWSCNKGNLPSAAVARKLGFRDEKEYPLLGWARIGTRFE